MRGGRLSRVGAGLVAALLVLVVVYFAFAKDIPFTKPYEMTAVFDNAAALQPNSPVRIAGVDVGKVSKVEPVGGDSTAAAVTMKITDDGLPIHRDATLKIRPRIFLEGNFFVDMRPGSPGAPEVKDGGTIASSQTSAPVQIDQVLGTLKSNAREDLDKLVQGYGDAIGGTPKPGEDDDQDPATRGETAGKSLNDSLGDAPASLRDSSIVADAFQGSERRDLSKLILGLQRTTSALGSREGQLKDLITNFNTTTAALADRQADVRNTIRLLPQVLDAADPAFDELNRSFPPTRAFAREILPGVRETPATISASLPWIAQTRKLVSPAELQGLVGDLQPSIRDMAAFTDGSIQLLPQLDNFNRCFDQNLLPTGDVVIQDGARTSGLKNSDEFFQSLVGLSGESQNFDGNGSYTRVQTGGGGSTVTTGVIGGGVKYFGNASRPPLGTRPARPSKKPPIKRSSACFRQKRADLNSARTGVGP
jgi:ABC-type transporter Mla subunit MlaD